MSIEDYKAGLNNMAHQAVAGEDIEQDIARFANYADLDPDMIRHEVSEIASEIE